MIQYTTKPTVKSNRYNVLYLKKKLKKTKNKIKILETELDNLKGIVDSFNESITTKQLTCDDIIINNNALFNGEITDESPDNILVTKQYLFKTIDEKCKFDPTETITLTNETKSLIAEGPCDISKLYITSEGDPVNDNEVITLKYFKDNSFDPSQTLELTNIDKSLIASGPVDVNKLYITSEGDPVNDNEVITLKYFNDHNVSFDPSKTIHLTNTDLSLLTDGPIECSTDMTIKNNLLVSNNLSVNDNAHITNEGNIDALDIISYGQSQIASIDNIKEKYTYDKTIIQGSNIKLQYTNNYKNNILYDQYSLSSCTLAYKYGDYVYLCFDQANKILCISNTQDVEEISIIIEELLMNVTILSACDNDDIIYFLTQDMNILVFNTQDKSFNMIPYIPPVTRIKNSVTSKQNILYINNDIYISASKKIIHYSLIYQKFNEIYTSTEDINGSIIGDNDIIYFITNSNIIIYDGDKFISHNLLDGSIPNIPDSDNVEYKCIVKDNMYVYIGGLNSKYIIRLSYEDNELQTSTISISESPINICSMCIYNNNLYIGTDTSTVYMYSIDDKYETYSYSIDDNFGENNSVIAIISYDDFIYYCLYSDYIIVNYLASNSTLTSKLLSITSVKTDNIKPDNDLNIILNKNSNIVIGATYNNKKLKYDIDNDTLCIPSDYLKISDINSVGSTLLTPQCLLSNNIIVGNYSDNYIQDDTTNMSFNATVDKIMQGLYYKNNTLYYNDIDGDVTTIRGYTINQSKPYKGEDKLIYTFDKGYSYADISYVVTDDNIVYLINKSTPTKFYIIENSSSTEHDFDATLLSEYTSYECKYIYENSIYVYFILKCTSSSSSHPFDVIYRYNTGTDQSSICFTYTQRDEYIPFTCMSILDDKIVVGTSYGYLYSYDPIFIPLSDEVIDILLTTINNNLTVYARGKNNILYVCNPDGSKIAQYDIKPSDLYPYYYPYKSMIININDYVYFFNTSGQLLITYKNELVRDITIPQLIIDSANQCLIGFKYDNKSIIIFNSNVYSLGFSSTKSMKDVYNKTNYFSYEEIVDNTFSLITENQVSILSNVYIHNNNIELSGNVSITTPFNESITLNNGRITTPILSTNTINMGDVNITCTDNKLDLSSSNTTIISGDFTTSGDIYVTNATIRHLSLPNDDNKLYYSDNTFYDDKTYGSLKCKNFIPVNVAFCYIVAENDIGTTLLLAYDYSPKKQMYISAHDAYTMYSGVYCDDEHVLIGLCGAYYADTDTLQDANYILYRAYSDEIHKLQIDNINYSKRIIKDTSNKRVYILAYSVSEGQETSKLFSCDYSTIKSPSPGPKIYMFDNAPTNIYDICELRDNTIYILCSDSKIYSATININNDTGDTLSELSEIVDLSTFNCSGIKRLYNFNDGKIYLTYSDYPYKYSKYEDIYTYYYYDGEITNAAPSNSNVKLDGQNYGDSLYKIGGVLYGVTQDSNNISTCRSYNSGSHQEVTLPDIKVSCMFDMTTHDRGIVFGLMTPSTYAYTTHTEQLSTMAMSKLDLTQNNKVKCNITTDETYIYFTNPVGNGCKLNITSGVIETI